MVHCHYLVAEENANLGRPEVTLPVIPGMEGCHWPLRKLKADNYKNFLKFILSGKSVKAKDSVGWLADYAGSMENSIKMAWKLASGGDHGLKKREVNENSITDIPDEITGLENTDDAGLTEARKAILDCIMNSCKATLAEAISVQAKFSGDFMTTKLCKKGVVGNAYNKTWQV